MISGSGSCSPYSSDLRSANPEPQPTALGSSFGATSAALRKLGNGAVVFFSASLLGALPRELNALREGSSFLGVPLT